MARGRLAKRLIEAIARYRVWRPDWAQGGCRFEPSCSHYAEDLLETRSVLVAIPLIVWRILRCNPLTRQGTWDPAPTQRRLLRPRANALRTAAVLGLAGGLAFVLAAGIAHGQGISGSGCTADINGRAPASMTRNNPLVVSEGQSVSVNGNAPPSVAALPPEQVQSQTVIQVSIIDPLGKVSSEARSGSGPAWGGSVGVDDYLKFGVGLYKVSGNATGTPGWTCAASGYVKLDGNPLTKPAGLVAAGFAAVGAAGVAASARGKPEDGQLARPAADGPTADEVKGDFGRDVDNVLGVPPSAPEVKPDHGAEAGANAGCAVIIALLSGAGIGEFLEELIYGPFDGALGLGVAATASAGGKRRRIWAKGHPIAGFISGLLAGLGLAVLAQQFGLWPLTIITAIVFPVLVAILCAARARLGRPFKVTA